MSYSVFGAGSGSGTLFPRFKIFPTPNIQGSLPDGAIPVVRSGNKNYFTVNKTTSIADADFKSVVTLNSTNPTAVILATDLTVITAGAKILGLHLSSANQCLYVLFKGTDLVVRLSKISDTTGAITSIGSFTPTTAAHWTVGVVATLEIVGGTLRYIQQGFAATMDITTGALLTEDVAFGLTGFSYTGSNYLTLDGTTYSDGLFTATPTGTTAIEDGALSLPTIVNASVGVVGAHYVDLKSVFGVALLGRGVSSAQTVFLPFILIDNDKVCFTQYISTWGCPLRVVTRTSFDDLLRSIVTWWGGA